MTLDEYEKLMEEKNANLNKAPPKKSAKADPKDFAGMTAYTRKVSMASASATLSAPNGLLHIGELPAKRTPTVDAPDLYSALTVCGLAAGH